MKRVIETKRLKVNRAADAQRHRDTQDLSYGCTEIRGHGDTETQWRKEIKGLRHRVLRAQWQGILEFGKLGGTKIHIDCAKRGEASFTDYL